MAVKVGSARIDERGKATGGQAGDQTGKELSTQNYYVHSNGWRVLRCIDPAKALKIAKAMIAACANSKIGYDQKQRLTLYNAAKVVGFDPGKVTTECETDCSALVRVCLAFAGITVGDFRTTNEASMILSSGMFVELTGSKYTTKSDFLRAGDVLVTKTKGHTVVVLNDGPKAETNAPTVKKYALGDRILRNGNTGADVKEMQADLISLGFSCGSYGADGDFGDATELAVRDFQRANRLDVDGVFGPKSLEALNKALNASEVEPSDPKKVKIVGGSCWARKAPDTDAEKIGVAHEGEELFYLGVTNDDGWHLVIFSGVNAWVSGKYGRLVA